MEKKRTCKKVNSKHKALLNLHDMDQWRKTIGQTIKKDLDLNDLLLETELQM